MSVTQSILIVDDEPNLRKTLALILQRDGYTVTTAGSADEAHQLLGAGAFGLVFLDIKMPDKNGLTLLKEIREIYPDMPIVLLTAHASLESAIEAVRAGNNRQMHFGPEIGDFLVFLTAFSLKSKQPAHRYQGIGNSL